MRKLIWLSVFCLWPGIALAEEISSAYSSFDLEKTCKLIEKGDEYVYAGTWQCPGFKDAGVLVSSSDDRDYVGFGKKAAGTCSFRKTFNRFSTALSPIEWRLKDGKAFAAIERWRVAADDDGNTVTWLVVTALKGDEACPISYVAGSYPDANKVARIMADDAGNFDCAHDAPTVNSRIGEPGITLDSCSDLAAE